MIAGHSVRIESIENVEDRQTPRHPASHSGRTDLKSITSGACGRVLKLKKCLIFPEYPDLQMAVFVSNPGMHHCIASAWYTLSLVPVDTTLCELSIEAQLG